MFRIIEKIKPKSEIEINELLKSKNFQDRLNSLSKNAWNQYKKSSKNQFHWPHKKLEHQIVD